jgi:tetratricopeptide (TPR) repeat protein/O-antigen ligase
MPARARNRLGNSSAPNASERIDRAIIWITLAALFIVPLIFSFFDIVATFSELKLVVLHLAAGTIAVLWVWQIVLQRLDSRSSSNNELNWDLVSWAGRNPVRWALIAAVGWVFAQLAATLLSPLPIISFFGGDEARSGYNLYDSLSLTVIFLSVALRFRTRRNLELLAYTLISTGTIAAAYGTAQHFGWDPIGGNTGKLRVIASFGNTLNFGGYMVMTIPATLALASKRFDRKWLWAAIIIGSLGLQIAGIWFSGGRGPFVAVAVSIITFFVIAAALGTTKQTLRSIAFFAVSSVIAAIIVVLPSPQGDIGLARITSIGDQLNNAGGTSTDIKGGLSGRFNIWGSTLQLATSWDVPVEESVFTSALRPLFGVGPDMLVYSFPFKGQPQSGLGIVDHAHNYELQLLIEQGFIGVISFLLMVGLLTVAVFAIVRRMQSAGRGIDSTGIIVLALLPAFIGKMVELQSGVGRVSDLTMNFALFGAVIAIYEIVNRQANPDESNATRTSSSSSSKLALSASNQTLVGSSLIAAIIISGVVLTTFIGWDVRRLSASVALAAGHDHPVLETRAQVWANAQAEAPERESFTVHLFEEYHKVAKQQKALGNDEEALRLLNVGRNMLLEYEKRDPFELDTQIGLSKITATFASWGYLEFSQELADRSQKIADTYPSYPTLVATAATGMASVGLHELAIEFAERAIATEPTTRPWAKAWYAKGRALFELGRDDEAISALTTATEKEPSAEGALLAHQVLAIIYKAYGDDALYDLHTELGQGDIKVQE